MAEISAARYRAGEGEPLVLLHGFTATWRCWLPVLAELVPRFDVFAPTLHGHDGGPQLPDPAVAHTVEQATTHVESLLDEAGIETAHLVGNSMGGALALELAKRGRARSVVAISPGGGWRRDDTKEAERIIKWFKLNQKLAKMIDPRAEKVLSRPGQRTLAFRDVMTRGDLVPAREAVGLLRSSINCSVVEDVFETIRSGDALLKDLDQSQRADARRVGLAGPDPAAAATCAAFPGGDPGCRVPRAPGPRAHADVGRLRADREHDRRLGYRRAGAGAGRRAGRRRLVWLSPVTDERLRLRRSDGSRRHIAAPRTADR